MVSMRVTFHVTLWDKVACWAVTPLQVSDHCLWLTPAQWSLGTGYNMLSNIVSHWDWFSDSHSFNFNQPMAIPFNVTLNICFLFYININKGTVCLSVVSWLPKSKFKLWIKKGMFLYLKEVRHRKYEKFYRESYNKQMPKLMSFTLSFKNFFI